MVNKVLASFLVADGLFVSMGAIMLGFCVIVRQTCFDEPTEGREAARDLLYRSFPFNGKIANVIAGLLWGLQRRSPRELQVAECMCARAVLTFWDRPRRV